MSITVVSTCPNLEILAKHSMIKHHLIDVETQFHNSRRMNNISISDN